LYQRGISLPDGGESRNVALEIERKFLVDPERWRPQTKGVLYRQGYLSVEEERVVRVRVAGEHAALTLKGGSERFSRLEFEYPIPLDDAAVLLERMCIKPLIEKTRYRQRFGNHVWEIDRFHGDNEGLTIAEIELSDESEDFHRPPWIGKEVSADPRYFNASLSIRPFRSW
jgi:adenylate cyclase